MQEMRPAMVTTALLTILALLSMVHGQVYEEDCVNSCRIDSINRRLACSSFCGGTCLGSQGCLVNCSRKCDLEASQANCRCTHGCCRPKRGYGGPNAGPDGTYCYGCPTRNPDCNVPSQLDLAIWVLRGMPNEDGQITYVGC